VREIEQEILSIDEVDVALIGVGPSGWPGLNDFEVIAAVGEVRMSAHDFDVLDSEVVTGAEVLAEVSVIDALHIRVVLLHILLVLIVMLFLTGLVFVIVVMFILGIDGQHSCEQKCGTDGPCNGESLHSSPQSGFFLPRARDVRGRRKQATQSRCGNRGMRLLEGE
jgi:hypothetical protein